ncbi:DUF1376 domain-containing protein [Psychrobacter sp. Rd 27.2]|uniref:DUF1376 domain-containing protein n=1 Tax=Psychrobacter sp. Rd 27.2 TaxID=1926479 RepID=UPI00094717C0|nr:DUF1376 domain-containing protein [Psychrobacter sp. Rd 27.2]OLF40806.1 hypothetical protein BTV99_07215 [Psychrobacter sp. Rd 27.2]
MHFVNHNFTDHDFETKHMSRIEKTIYLDLRSLYLSEEKPIDGSDMELLQRRLSVISDDEKQALAFVLKDKFKKAGKYYKRAAWDKILKDYKWGNKNKGNANGNATRNGVTIDVTQGVTPSNDGCNVTCNDNDTPMTPAERVRKSRQDKRNMINALTNIGVSVDKGIGAAALRELHAKHIDAIKQCHASNVTNDVTQTVTPSNDDCNAGNAKNAAITKNHKPLTNNHKPVSESAHTNTGEAVVENFNHGSVANSTDNNQSSANQPAPVAPAHPTQSTANQQPTTAELIRSQHADSIENWEAPTIDQMRGELFKAGKMIKLTDDQYQFEISAFKAHYAEQALKGNPLTTESYRKVKLVKWMIREANNQKADQARQEKAKGRFNIDNEDWSNSAGKSSNGYDSDLPDVFHPSHSQPVQAKIDPSKCCIFNGLRKEPLPNMDIAETYEYVAQHKMPGESADETYDRVLNQLQEAV